MDKIKTTTGDSKRSKNFKDVEVNVLLDLVQEHKDILENKQTDQVTLKDKEKSWMEIERQFNQVSGVYFRDWKTLKNKYDNIKKTSKRKWADEKKYVLGTGGGPSMSTSLTQTDLRIKEILGDLSVIGKKSRFDSDAEVDPDLNASFFEKPSEAETNIDLSYLPVVLEEEIDNPPPEHSYALGEENLKFEVFAEPQETSSGQFDVQPSPKKKFPTTETNKPKVPLFDNQFTVKKLQSKSSSPLQVRKKRASPLDSTVAGRKIEIMAKTKSDLFELQKSLVQNQLRHEEEEHSLKLRFLEEEHSKKMKVLDLKIKNQELKIRKNRLGLNPSNP